MSGGQSFLSPKKKKRFNIYLPFLDPGCINFFLADPHGLPYLSNNLHYRRNRPSWMSSSTIINFNRTTFNYDDLILHF